MKLVTTKYFPIVVFVLCLANLFLFSIGSRRSRATRTAASQATKLRPVDEQSTHLSQVELAAYWQPDQDGDPVQPAGDVVTTSGEVVVPASASSGSSTSSSSEKITITLPDVSATLKKLDNDRFITKHTSIQLTANLPGNAKRPGKLTWFRDSVAISTQDIALGTTSSAVATIQLLSNQTNAIGARYISDNKDGGEYIAQSGTLLITCDTVGPMLQHAEVIAAPSTGTTLVVTFDADDFDKPTSTARPFRIERQDTNNTFSEEVEPQGAPVVAGRTVRLSFGNLPAGQYRLTVKDESKDDKDVLKDIVGNTAAPRQWVFSVHADRTFGQHIEFPPYSPPRKQTIPPEGFNPGDFVETRVARLYYYRDAHRVAEIINRNIRSYNQAAVTLAERRAERSRDDADSATDERRQREREAVQAAEQARNAEQKLASVREALLEIQGLQNAIADDEKRLSTLPFGDPQKDTLQGRIEQNKYNLGRLGGSGAIEALSSQVGDMERSVANLRQTELVKREAAAQSEAKEARAREKQFRDEVTAAKADPDTYVAGDVHSIDPVTQVSISVIGEGLIQLRGPIKGINKIRTMINQIDSPVGQIKIGIFTVQVNGEEGAKMEKVIGDAESNIDLSRFLVNHSLELLRRTIQSEAAMISSQCAMEGHYQVDRDRRYLYSFFGRDFIDELYAMNSEFLNSENKLLSLHAMDTIGLNRALFILALAKNDVRERIIMRFLESAKTELADAEYDFRRSSELKPHTTEKFFPPWNRTHLPVHNHYHKEDLIYEAVHRNALQRYHFRNFNSFFDNGIVEPDTMNPMQREFIRLAQIFKAQLVAEMELKQRVLERGLIEDRSNSENDKAEIMRQVHSQALELSRNAYFAILKVEENLQAATDAATDAIYAMSKLTRQLDRLDEKAEAFKASVPDFKTRKGREKIQSESDIIIADLIQIVKTLNYDFATPSQQEELKELLQSLEETQNIFNSESFLEQAPTGDLGEYDPYGKHNKLMQAHGKILDDAKTGVKNWNAIRASAIGFKLSIEERMHIAQGIPNGAELHKLFDDISRKLDEYPTSSAARLIRENVKSAFDASNAVANAEERIQRAEELVRRTRGSLDHRKLLNHLIDEQEEKFIELVEGTRSHIAVMDGYLKRLSIALEDDFKVQFYDPAFVRVREAARARQVNLGQVERTTILTNNRAFAKVDPQATMEFDLPKRQIAIKEAFDAARALVEDSGALINDPTFLAAFQMMGGSQQPSTVKNLLPGQSQSTDQQIMGLVPGLQESGVPGSALQNLVPEPAIFKLETGTGFQIRPVMQPDGDSVVYDFDYMYTTNIREPVRADEKHIGRIKRHFVHTAVQTGNFELREISRYQVALKVSRTSQGVPLLQNVPVVGAAFRPAPSAESSIQQNIILGQTNVYPTLFDLMGLRWAQQVVDLDHTSLMDAEHVVRGRQKSIRDTVFEEASRRVDEFLDIPCKSPESYRPDFYHSKTLSSPYHPGGYRHPNQIPDPTGQNYERIDRRPPEMQEPPFDRYRHQPVNPEHIGPRVPPEIIPQPPLQLDLRHSQMPTR